MVHFGELLPTPCPQTMLLSAMLHAQWRDIAPATDDQLHELLIEAIQHVVFLRCPNVETLFSCTDVKPIQQTHSLQYLYNECAVPEEWRVYPAAGSVTLPTGSSDVQVLLPHIPFERPTKELSMLCNAKTPLEM